MNTNDNTPLKLKLNMDVLWTILYERKKREQPFGRNNKVRVACGIEPAHPFFGKNLASKSKSNKKIIFDKRLYDALIQCMKNFNHIPQEPPIKIDDDYFGTCAEDDAANQLLGKEALIGLNDILFSLAIDPITFRRVDYCAVCCNVFGLNNNV